MAKKYVKLKDKGTIFHDSTKGITVTGSVPKEIEITPNIKTAISKGILVVVDDSEAKKAIAVATGNAENAKKEVAAVTDEKVAEANAAKDTALAALELVTKERDEAVSKLAEAEAKAEESKSELAKVTEESKDLVPKGDSVPKSAYDELVAKLKSTETALNTTKQALAKATKK